MQNLIVPTPEEIRGFYLNDFVLYTEKVFKILNPTTQFHRGWHIDAMCEHLEACRRREIKRLIINIPPRHMKSITANMSFSSWLMGHDPSEKLIVGSHGLDLSREHSVHTRDIMRSEWYRHLFPNTQLKDDQDTKELFYTTRGGKRQAVSLKKKITGKGGNIIMLDDPNDLSLKDNKKHLDEVINWYDTVVYSRLDDKVNGVIILIQQRCGEKDLTGHILKGYDKFEILKLPSEFNEDRIISIGKFKKEVKKGELLHEPTHPRAVLETIKKRSPTAYAGQYLQEPAPLEGSIIKNHWYKWYDLRAGSGFTEIYQSWDTAIKEGQENDFTVCTTWGVKDNCHYLLDVYMDKIDYPSLVKAVKSQYMRFKPRQVIIEDKASGQSLLQDLKRNTDLPIVAYNPGREDKISRLFRASVNFESGRVYLPSDAPWLADVLHQLKLFPAGDNDDIVDTISQYLNWYSTRSTVYVMDI